MVSLNNRRVDAGGSVSYHTVDVTTVGDGAVCIAVKQGGGIYDKFVP